MIKVVSDQGSPLRYQVIQDLTHPILHDPQVQHNILLVLQANGLVEWSYKTLQQISKKSVDDNPPSLGPGAPLNDVGAYDELQNKHPYHPISGTTSITVRFLPS